MEWSDERLIDWRSKRQSYLADASAIKQHQQIYQKKLLVQQEMRQVLISFLDNTISLRELNKIFQQNTHEAWSVFHLRGMSGGLFLNKLVKYIPNEETFAPLLRMLLRVPGDILGGYRNMHTLVHCLEEIIRSQQAARWQLQPARVPFFLSAWWHIQEAERWPIFYLEVRHVLLSEDVNVNTVQDSIDAYFAFRAKFLALTQALGLSAWELEQFILWNRTNSAFQEATRPVFYFPELVKVSNDKRTKAVNTYSNAVSKRGNMVYKRAQRETSHTYAQWLLAKIGLKIGCSVWIAINDHEKVWGGEKLGDLSLPSLPILTSSASQQIAQHIDVLWLCKNDIIAAYEIELITADIVKSLLRLSDLAVLSPKCDAQLCVVTPQRCFDSVRSELAHPIFQMLEIHKQPKVIIQEHLAQNAEHILRWAHSPSVIQDLTLYSSAKE